MTQRNCWVILERKAHDQVREVQQTLSNQQAQADQLQQTLDRLTGMYAEYQAHEQQGGTQVGLQHRMNQRQFMAQLMTLKIRVESDLAQKLAAMAKTRAELIKAEAERMKMQALVDQQASTARQLQAMVEQKHMDEFAVRRFNKGIGS